ncbi:MAG: hypothetical protein AAGG48_30120 [Planctomycetota bacterium]
MKVRPPKFRLSTLLLIAAIAALSVSLCVERERSKTERAKHEHQLADVRVGASQWGESEMLARLSEAYRDQSSDREFAATLNHELVFAVYWLWQQEDDVNFSALGEPIAVTKARTILESLNCSTADDYFAVAKELKFAGWEPEDAPVWLDRKAVLHTSLRDFVNRSLQSEYVASWER